MTKKQTVVREHQNEDSGEVLKARRAKKPIFIPANRSRLVRLTEVQARVGLSRSTLYSRIQQGSFPRPVRLGEKSVAWVETEIDNWIGVRVAEAGKEIAE